jgi:hypothetical protein
MKKQYIIPSSVSVFIQTGSICQTSGNASGPIVNGPNVGVGGEAQDIGSPD